LGNGRGKGLSYSWSGTGTDRRKRGAVQGGRRRRSGKKKKMEKEKPGVRTILIYLSAEKAGREKEQARDGTAITTGRMNSLMNFGCLRRR